MVFEPLEQRLALAAGLVDVGAQPTGALTGKVVFTSAGHGWQWSDAVNRWATDRGNTLSLVEDFGNQDQLTYYVDYLFRAGATVAPMRPVGRQSNEVVLDNDSAGVTFAGSWTNNTAGPRWYDEDYGATLDIVKYRFASVNTTTETATATYTPNLPASGLYPVYTWVPHSANRTNQLYKINHTGGTTEVRVNHRNVGNGWVYLGSYHFASGSSVDGGSVQISNRSSFGGSVVIADSIRFGNGMGDLRWNTSGIGSGNISGFSREDEGSILWTWRGIGQSTSFTSPSTVLGTSNVSAPLRMAEEMHADGVPYGTSVYISFHSNATTGDPTTATARGAIGLIHSTSPTPNQANLALFAGRQLNVDMRALNGQFEHDWSTRTSYTLTGSFGEMTNTVANGKFDATIVEVGFHDTQTDNELLRDAKVRRQLGRSTYEATLEHLFNHFGTTTQPVNVTLPSPPINVLATSPQSGSVVVRWTPGPSSTGGFSGVNGSPAIGYRVYASVHGYGFDGGTFVSGASTNSLTLSGYDPSIAYYFKVVAENTGGQSTESEVLAVNPNGGNRQVLIVNGFDRIDRSQGFKQPYAFGGVTTDRVWERYGNSRDYSVQVQTAIQSARPGIRVDSTSNEAVINGTVILSDYEAVIWILGTESVANQTFSAAEQTLANLFVAGGGDLLVTGAEAGYDLDSQNNGRTFYRTTLGASYVADSSGSYVTSPVAGGIFAGLTNISFSNGSTFSSLDGETYNVAFADVLSPQAGATAALQYVGSTGGVAAIQKPGTDGRGNVVTFGFPLETVVTPAARSQVIDRILGFFNVRPIAEPVATIANRRVFYNNAIGGNLSSAGSAENAIASDKNALLPGGASIYANYTNYVLGLNGLIVDIRNLPATTTNIQILSSFQFAQWNGIDAGGFAALPVAVVPTAAILSGSGAGGSARVKVTFPDNALQNTWLRVTVLANSQTALATNDIFYFGNVIGDFDTGNTETRLRVNATDTGAVRSNQSITSNSASVTNIYDVNRDGRVNATDTGIVRSNQQTTGIVAPIITPPLPSSIGQIPKSIAAAPRIDTASNKNDRVQDAEPMAILKLSAIHQTFIDLNPTSAAYPKPEPAEIQAREEANSIESSKLQTLDEFFAELRPTILARWALG